MQLRFKRLNQVKTVIFKRSIVLDGRRLNINANKKLGSFKEILCAIKSQMDSMLSHHSRVLLLRMDLHVHDYTESNLIMSNFLRKLKKKLRTRYKLARVGHIWARETETTNQQHYHLAIMIDAHKVKHPHKVISTIEEIWLGWDLPKPYTPRNCYRVIHRSDASAYQEQFYRLSYLAKLRGKGYRAKTANDYSSSRINKKKSPELSPNKALASTFLPMTECHST